MGEFEPEAKFSNDVFFYLTQITKFAKYRCRPISAFVYLLMLSQSERVDLCYFRFRLVFLYESYGGKECLREPWFLNF